MWLRDLLSFIWKCCNALSGVLGTFLAFLAFLVKKFSEAKDWDEFLEALNEYGILAFLWQSLREHWPLVLFLVAAIAWARHIYAQDLAKMNGSKKRKQQTGKPRSRKRR